VTWFSAFRDKWNSTRLTSFHSVGTLWWSTSFGHNCLSWLHHACNRIREALHQREFLMGAHACLGGLKMLSQRFHGLVIANEGLVLCWRCLCTLWYPHLPVEPWQGATSGSDRGETNIVDAGSDRNTSEANQRRSPNCCAVARFNVVSVGLSIHNGRSHLLLRVTLRGEWATGY